MLCSCSSSLWHHALNGFAFLQSLLHFNHQVHTIHHNLNKLHLHNLSQKSTKKNVTVHVVPSILFSADSYIHDVYIYLMSYLRFSKAVNVGDVVDASSGSSVNTTCASLLQLQLLQDLSKFRMLHKIENYVMPIALYM